MDIVAGSLCAVTHWLFLHLSREDFFFYYHFLHDYKKAALSDDIFMHWDSFSARRTRLIGHFLILVLTAGVYIYRAWCTAVAGRDLVTFSAHANGFFERVNEDGLPPNTSASARIGDTALSSAFLYYLPLQWLSSLFCSSSTWLSFWRAVKQDALAVIYTGMTSAFHICVLFSGSLVDCCFRWLDHHCKHVKKDKNQLVKTLKMTAFMNIPSPLFFLELSVASITEEVVFRGLLAYILRHRRVWVNIFFSSLIFSASHIPKFALLLCAHLREEFAVDVMTAATGSSCVDEDPAGTLQRNSKIIEEKELETRQLAARQAQKLFDSPRNVSRLNQIQREVLKDLALNLAITMGFGMLIGCLYRTVYQLQLAPLIIAHLLCNLFGIPKFYCLRMNKTPFENKFIMWITVGCYICGVAGWLKMILVS